MNTQKCDKFDQTIYLLLSQFSDNKPITIENALKKIDDDKYYSMSLSVRPVTKFVKKSIAGDGYITKVSSGGYILTNKGIKMRKIYKDIVVE